MKQKSIKKNMLMNIILTMSNFLFPLITYGYASRILTPVGTGKVAFVSSIISYFSYIAILGIPAYGLREAAKVRDNKEKLSKLVHELLIINVISTIISYLLLVICVLLIPKLNDYKLLFLVMSLSIGLNTIGLEWLYQAMEEYSYITIRSLIFKLLYVPLVFLLINSKEDYLIYGFLTIFVTSANYICNFINIRKYITFKKFKKYEFKKHLKPILVLFSASIIISVYANFDTIMIGFIKDEFDVGLYNTALKIKSIILSVSTAVTTVLIPRIAYNFSKNNFNEIKKLVMTSLKVSLLLAFPLTIFILVFPENVILFISGKDYINAVSTLRILMLCVLVLILTNLFGNQLLLPMGKEKIYSQSVFIGLFINLTLNFLLIPKYGSYGAAIGTLVTECWNAYWMGNGVREYTLYLIKNSRIYIYIISALFASLLSYGIFKLIENNSDLIILLITGIIFISSYYLILLILKEEVLTKELIKINRKIRKEKVS